MQVITDRPLCWRWLVLRCSWLVLRWAMQRKERCCCWGVDQQ
jgi:hypothetical protein